jgi:succinate dehydrogenase / fumarate reductase, cytochrome b subunit
MTENSTRSTARARPLSPHWTHMQWPLTMATSIVHRGTGLSLSVGAIALCWWLYAVASGPVAFDDFNRVASTPLGQVVLFGLIWSLGYHLLNGIRHLAWDLGFGFALKTAHMNSILAIAGSIVLAAAVFAVAYTGHAGWNN